MEGKAAGATGWLVKPFDEAQLIAVVRKFVR
jgi:two-component system chemotaxis response regulator CheY